MEANHKFYARRAAAEAQAALRSVTDEGRAIHQDLAQRFSRLSEEYSREDDEFLLFQ
ncbi:MAG: hypothetical protein H7X93_06490 [Sphingomonadaceae bacterium]|nr:hypothetical protein [Sphingomonadaceae bacterium]